MESGQSLENVDRTHLVLASGKLVLQKQFKRNETGWLTDRASKDVVKPVEHVRPLDSSVASDQTCGVKNMSMIYIRVFKKPPSIT